jgi:outer membrane immunogenic protein
MKKLLLGTVAALAVVTSAEAADLGAARVPVAAAVMAPAFNWTGFYLGVHAGYGFGHADTVNIIAQSFPSSPVGPLIGGQIGFNYQINSIVLGAEADLAFAAVSGRHQVVAFPGISIYHRTTALGSLRARGGYAVDRALFYVTGGLGFQRVTFGQADPGGGVEERYSRTGWTLGAGVEYAITPNVTAKLEYAYYNFGTHLLSPPFVATVRNDVHTVKVGVNYLFSTGPAAVVARY